MSWYILVQTAKLRLLACRLFHRGPRCRFCGQCVRCDLRGRARCQVLSR